MTNRWVEQFPGNLKWSNATLVTKGMAPYGVVALNDIERVCERLAARQDEHDAWHEEWSAMADHTVRLAEAADAAGRRISAGDYYMRAGYYYYTAERMIPPGPFKTEVYRKSLACHREGLRRSFTRIEPVEVPYEGGTLPAYFLKAADADGPAPTVVVFDGLDNCKEMSVIFAGLEFSRRGFNTLAIDGPGQGETLRLRNIPSRYDYEVPGRAAYDYVAGRPEVDPSCVTVLGYSFGGYAAPRIAAFDGRYAGCVAFGAMFWDLRGWLVRIEEEMRNHQAATSHFQVPWVLGVPDLDMAKAIEMMGRFTLEGVAERIACPFLVVHGANDRLIPPSQAQILYERAGSADKTLRIFTEDEGAAEHCQVDDRRAGVNFIADWISETVVPQARP
ncbi:alpha/beta hydrolase [Propylenella binzhouense]|uniref:Alpha/beta hydrolase n=1 Tax=Propylenella binzhouense TaxID=2555902 RepID=A0A964WT30_9HYPH|nr:alpha/beta fold hydrolase [Propylenella binzhouense]MYZ47583.1 alpha/beta hydrolase [Propylenella binzhouense]